SGRTRLRATRRPRRTGGGTGTTPTRPGRRRRSLIRSTAPRATPRRTTRRDRRSHRGCPGRGDAAARAQRRRRGAPAGARLDRVTRAATALTLSAGAASLAAAPALEPPKWSGVLLSDDDQVVAGRPEATVAVDVRLGAQRDQLVAQRLPLPALAERVARL